MKNIKKATKVPSLKIYCQKNISNYDFERLHEIANVSKHSVTKAFENPPEMKFPLLIALSKLLKEQPIDLINKYNCGLRAMTAEQYRSLLPLPQTNENQ